MATRTTLKQQKQIVKMYTVKKMTQAAIAKELGLTPGGVAFILHRHGVRSRDYGGLGGNRRYQLSVKQLEKVSELYTSGESCEAIARVIKVPWSVVNARLKEMGVVLRPGGFRKGTDHHCWSGGRAVTSSGYVNVLVPEDDPLYGMAQTKVGKVRYAPEHRIVMARHLGRPLRRDETVHHIDGNKQNNHISNLQLRQGRHGKGVVLRCADCGSHNLVPSTLN